MLIRKSGIADDATVRTSPCGFRLTVSFGVRAEIGGCGGRLLFGVCLLGVLALLACYAHTCTEEQDFKLLERWDCLIVQTRNGGRARSSVRDLWPGELRA